MPKIPDDPVWKKMKIKVASQLVQQDNPPQEIQAEVIGVIAVHPVWENVEDKLVYSKSQFSITALSCGMTILRCSSREEALKIGEMLSKKFVIALSKKTKVEVVAKLPRWFKAWAMDSQKAGKGLPMEQYEEKR